MARLPPALRPWWPQVKTMYTFATRSLAPATRQLSRARGGSLPRGVARRAEDGVGSGTGCGARDTFRDDALDVVVPATETIRPVPDGIPTRHWAFARSQRVVHPRGVVALLAGGRVLGRHGAVITRDGRLVDELSPYFDTTSPWEHPLFLHPFAGKPRHFDGSVGVLAGVGDFNYCHFLLDILPRYWMIDRCTRIPRPDRWYVPQELPFQRELVASVGIDPRAVIDSRTVPHIRAESLVAPSHPDFTLEAPQWTITRLRQHLLPSTAGIVPGTRLYIARSGRRNNRVIRNEPAIRELLLRRGFSPIDPTHLSVRDQATAFAHAEVVVAPHGAALANLAFASPGSLVLELFAPDYVKTCYWALSQRVPGLAYRYLVGEGTVSRARERAMKGVASDITIDPDKVTQILDSALDRHRDSHLVADARRG